MVCQRQRGAVDDDDAATMPTTGGADGRGGSGSGSGGGGGGVKISLRKSYRNAVDCLVQCEAIIRSLEETIAEKDDRIAALEDRIVEMSLELASSKAFEDEHRSRRRTISGGDDDGDNDGDDNNDDGDDRESLEDGEWRPRRLQPQLHWRPKKSSRSRAVHAASVPATEAPRARKSRDSSAGLSWSLASLGSMSWVSGEDEEAEEDDPHGASSDDMNLSSSSVKSVSFTGFFRRRRSNSMGNGNDNSNNKSNSDWSLRRGESEGTSRSARNEKGNSAYGSTKTKDRKANDAPRRLPPARPRRRPSRRRSEDFSLMGSLKSSGKSLEGVVFPSSFEEVLSKGCEDLRNSLRKKKMETELFGL